MKEEDILIHFYIKFLKNEKNLIFSNNTLIKNVNNKILSNILDDILKKQNNKIYSEILFYLKFPTFNLMQFITFHPEFKNLDNLNILNIYYNLENKKDYIISNENFYALYPLFDLSFYKKYNIKLDFQNDEEYIFDWR
jgi:hypothetical protein